VQRLEGKVAIITGSSGGIGEGIARVFDAEGASLVINSRTGVDEGRAVAASLSDAHYVQGDVSSDDQARRLVDEALERWGRLDILVNNAGFTIEMDHDDLDALTDEVWEQLLANNLKAPWYVTRAAVPALRATGDGAVINVGSVSGVRSTYWERSSLAYGVAEAALNHLTTLLATVLGPEIRVNGVLPGVIFSRASTGALYPMVEQTAPLGRIGQPRDIGDACLLMACGRYITGENLVVDGGLLLRK